MQRALFILGILEDEDVDWLISVGQRQEPAPGFCCLAAYAAW